MTKTKKLAVILLTTAILFTFSACDENNGDNPPENPANLLASENGGDNTPSDNENGGNETIPLPPPDEQGTYEGERDANGLRSGYGVWTYLNFRYEGYWENGKPNGWGLLFRGNVHGLGVSDILKAFWIDGSADGEVISYNFEIDGENYWTYYFDLALGFPTKEGQIFGTFPTNMRVTDSVIDGVTYKDTVARAHGIQPTGNIGCIGELCSHYGTDDGHAIVGPAAYGLAANNEPPANSDIPAAIREYLVLPSNGGERPAPAPPVTTPPSGVNEVNEIVIPDNGTPPDVSQSVNGLMESHRGDKGYFYAATDNYVVEMNEQDSNNDGILYRYAILSFDENGFQNAELCMYSFRKFIFDNSENAETYATRAQENNLISDYIAIDNVVYIVPIVPHADSMKVDTVGRVQIYSLDYYISKL